MGNGGFEIEGISRIKNILFVLCPELQCPFQKIDEFLSFVAEIAQFLRFHPPKLNQERLHIFLGLLRGQGLIIVATLLPSKISGVDHFALIPSHKDHFFFGIIILKEKTDIDIQCL